MNLIIKESLKTSGINYIGILLGAFFTLYLTPKFLPTEQNGLYRLLLEYSAIIAVYFHFGMPTIINKFFHKIHYDLSITKGFDFFVFVLPLIIFFCFGILFYFFSSEITHMVVSSKDFNLFNKYIFFLIPLVICNAYFFIFEAYLAMLGNITFVNFFKSIVIKSINIISILLYIITNDFNVIMIFISIGYIISTIIVFIYLFKLKNYKINLSPSLKFLIKNNLLNDFFKFFLFLCLTNITYFLLSKIDIFFVGKLTNLSNLAYYSTATYFVTLILVPYAAVLNISFPRIAKTYTDGDLDTLKILIVNNSIYGFVLALYIFVLIWSNLDAIYFYIPKGNLYKAGKYIFLILSIGKLIDISIGSLGQLITISKWYPYILYSSIIISIISLVSGYYLTLNFGIIGAAFSLSFCNLLSVISQLSIAKIKIKIHPYNNNFLKVIFIALFLILFCIIIDKLINHLIIASILKIISLTILYFYIVYKFKISNEINYILDRIFNKFSLNNL